MSGLTPEMRYAFGKLDEGLAARAAWFSRESTCTLRDQINGSVSKINGTWFPFEFEEGEIVKVYGCKYVNGMLLFEVRYGEEIVHLQHDWVKEDLITPLFFSPMVVALLAQREKELSSEN